MRREIATELFIGAILFAWIFFGMPYVLLGIRVLPIVTGDCQE